MFEIYNSKIEEKISEYLEFNVNDLFIGVDQAVIFGGAIRDTLANVNINDIDIMCFSDSYRKLKINLEKNDYFEAKRLCTKDIMNLYSDIRIICEPTTYIKKSNYDVKIVQLIRPGFVKGSDNSRNNAFGVMKLNFENALRNVDINICGVAWNPTKGLYEVVDESIFYILNKYFYVNSNAAMFQRNRIYGRVSKMIDKGFTCLTNGYDRDFTFKNINEITKNLDFKKKRFYKLHKLI